jgi:hypothetical protein
MFCNKCGNQIKDGAAFCNSCGTPTKSSGVNPPLQSPVQNIYTSAVTPYNPATPQTGGAAAPAKMPMKPMKLNKKIVVIAAALIVVIVGVLSVYIIQENNKKEIAAAQREQDLSAIDDVLTSYARAFQSLNFEYAATFCVPGAQVNQRIMDGLPSITIKGFSLSLGDLLSSAGSFLNWVADLADIGFRYELAYDKSNISLRGEKATVNVVRHVSCVYLIDTTASQTITLSKSDGTWLIESIS